MGRQGTSSGKAQSAVREAPLSNYPDEITIGSWAQAASREADALIHREAPRDAGRAGSRGAGSAVFLTCRLATKKGGSHWYKGPTYII